MGSERVLNRRTFLTDAALAVTGLGLSSAMTACSTDPQRPHTGYKISLAEGSLRRAIAAKQLDHLGFMRAARQDFEIEAVELSSQFFQQPPNNRDYLAEIKGRADANRVRVLLIRVDGAGALGDPDPAQRRQAVSNHAKWVEAAHALGCHSIRVRADTGEAGTRAVQQARMAEGLRALAEVAADYRLNLLVENHGGLSADPSWLTGILGLANRSNCGTLPAFGTFLISPGREYNRYRGVAEMMPWAKAVSATSYDFDEAGWEANTDYRRMLRIILAARYYGYIGIDYQGTLLSEREGILATKRLLERLRTELTAPKPPPKHTPTDVGGRT